MIIGVDVDNTVAQTDKAWWQWLCDQSGVQRDCPEGEVNYNLSTYFPELEIDGLDFFRGEDVYDHVEVMDGAIEVLESLSKDHEIVFVSAIKGNHNKCKYNWLKKHFPFMSGYIATKEKWYTCVNIMVEDRADILNRMNCDRIKFKSLHTQTEVLHSLSQHADNWEQVGRIVRLIQEDNMYYMYNND